MIGLLLCWLGLHAAAMSHWLRPTGWGDGPRWVLMKCNRDGCHWQQWEEDLDG